MRLLHLTIISCGLLCLPTGAQNPLQGFSSPPGVQPDTPTRVQGKRSSRQQWRIYSDSETGVTFRYPLAWTKKMGSAYGPDPMSEDEDASQRIAERVRVGWVFPEVPDNPGDTVEGEVSFAYAILRSMRTPDACQKAFRRWDSEGKMRDERINGTNFHVISYSDAGLGHSWSFDIYTTFHRGRCLGFSIGSNASHGVDPIPFSKNDQLVPSNANDVLRTLRLEPLEPKAVDRVR